MNLLTSITIRSQSVRTMRLMAFYLRIDRRADLAVPPPSLSFFGRNDGKSTRVGRVDIPLIFWVLLPGRTKKKSLTRGTDFLPSSYPPLSFASILPRRHTTVQTVSGTFFDSGRLLLYILRLRSSDFCVWEKKRERESEREKIKICGTEKKEKKDKKEVSKLVI